MKPRQCARRARRDIRLMMSCAMLLSAACGTAADAEAQEPTQDAHAVLARQLEFIRRDGRLDVGNGFIALSSGVDRLYDRDEARPLWSDPAAVADLRQAVRSVYADGLDPSSYHVEIMDDLERVVVTPLMAARLDLLRTDALIRLTRDLRFGRARSSRPVFAETWGAGAADEPATLRRMISSGRLLAEVEAMRPDHPIYQGMRDALAELRRVQRAGGWIALDAGPTLRIDSVDPRVPLLRRRLELEGYMDAGLVDAVRAFQHRHGLNEDGVVGPATLAALNMPVQSRIDQVRVNLERARWIVPGLPDTYLVVNIAGARVYLIRSGATVFESRAVVGALSTRTPVFRAVLSEVVLNPTWTVPRSIVGEVLTAIGRDPEYLERNGFRVVDRAGVRIDVRRVNFSHYTGATFPYVFVQDPGAANPLGRIKLVFPNSYNVYLHDTPARGLFGREQRTFSHGCIRVENPVRLGGLVLQGQGRWTPDAIEAAIAVGSTVTIPVSTPLPVLILYWTAATDLHGELHYYSDVYGRDAQLLREIDRR
jgi:murein L,D-transpeptidase YcbB/YkuD